MESIVDDPRTERSIGTRGGVSALNLIAPGLGLLRLGIWRVAILFLLAPFALFALIIFGMGHFPLSNYHRVVVGLIAIIGSSIALYLLPTALTWRESRVRFSGSGWSRWYGLTAVAVVFLSLSNFAVPLLHRFYKPFYAPAESMAPTIGKGDKFIADMRWRGPFKRGQVVIFNGSYGVRVSRIAALPGDRIAMRGGVPVLNGEAAQQSPDGQTSFLGFDGLHLAARVVERLHGEAGKHNVLDSGPSEFDDMQEVIVPANHFFVLGDNRDSSADSRVPPELGGVGMVPNNAVIGRPMYIHWSSDHAKVGTRLDEDGPS